MHPMGPPWQGTRQPRKDSQTNVERVLLAAGADGNRQRHLERGLGRRRDEVAGSAHEPILSDDGGVTSSQATKYVSLTPVTPGRGKGALELGGFTDSAMVGHSAGDESRPRWNETMGKPGSLGRMRISA
jgi:hypothetical protein